MDTFTSELSSKKIVLADSFSPGRLVLSEILQYFGYKHKVISEGEELLIHLKSQKADLILLDLNLKGFGDFEVMEHIRRNLDYPNNIVPVVAMADRDFDENSDYGSEHNDFAAVIRKPFSLDELDYTLRTVLYPEQTFETSGIF